MTIILIVVAGASGAICRFAVSQWFNRSQAEAQLPTPILCINIFGSFLLGLAHTLFQSHSNEWGAIITTWFLGAFTTFSTFSLESIHLIRDKKWMILIVYLSLTILGSILAYSVGFLLV